MAFTQPTMATNNIQALDPLPNDNTGLTDDQLQLIFDQFGIDMKAYIIAHLAELASTTLGSSGAENIGSALIPGITGTTIRTQIANLLAIAQSAQAGTILPGTITDSMLSNLAGQIKDTVNTHLADDVRHLTTLNQNKINRAYSASKLYAYKNIGGAL